MPTFDPEYEAEASTGSYGYLQATGSWSQPLSDGLAARLSVAHTSQSGFVSDVTTGRALNGSDRNGARAQLLFRSGDAFTLRVIGAYSEEHSDAGAFVLYSAGPDNGAKYYAAVAMAGAHVVYDPDYDTVTIDGRQHFDVQQESASAEAIWRMGPGTLTAVSAYRHWKFLPYSDGDYRFSDRITLWAKNLFDKRYVLGGLSASGPLYNYIATPGWPRTIGVSGRIAY